MIPTPQDRARAFFNKVGIATLWGEGVFIVLLLLVAVVIVPTVDALLPPEPPTDLFDFGRAFGFFMIGIAASLLIACFVSGMFFSNPRNNPTLLGWPISLHGFFSGFIIGGLIPALVLTLLSKRIHGFGWVEMGIPAGFAGFLGSAAGGAYHWWVAHRK